MKEENLDLDLEVEEEEDHQEDQDPQEKDPDPPNLVQNLQKTLLLLIDQALLLQKFQVLFVNPVVHQNPPTTQRTATAKIETETETVTTKETENEIERKTEEIAILKIEEREIETTIETGKKREAEFEIIQRAHLQRNQEHPTVAPIAHILNHECF